MSTETSGNKTLFTDYIAVTAEAITMFPFTIEVTYSNGEGTYTLLGANIDLAYVRMDTYLQWNQ